MPAKLDPTPEQSEIIRLVREVSDNLIINALAGTGKTSTLEMIQAASRDQPVLCLAFNRNIAKEMARRFPSTTTVRTFNGMGHRIWNKAVGNATVNPEKSRELLGAILDDLSGDDRKEVRDAYWDIIKAVGYAKSIGYIPEGKFLHAKRLASREAFYAGLDEEPSEIVGAIIDDILLTSITTAYKGNIDYNDQVYMPALFGGTFPRFPLVMVDEAQDLSPVNHALLHKLVANRLCVVGDRWQSIYGFRGALLGGMDRLEQKFSMTQADLSISFRCPQAVVESVRWRVPNFKWIKPGGIVAELRNATATSFPDGCAVICRNNAPLFHLAFQLLSHRRSVKVFGSDIGPKLVATLNRIGQDDDDRETLIARINAWEQEKLTKSNAPATIMDMAACMRVFASFGDTFSSAVAHADHLFKQEGTVQMMTGHKAKGLEFDNVYHLNEHLIGTDEQELNLRYVISTRARAAYYEINSEDIRL